MHAALATAQWACLHFSIRLRLGDCAPPPRRHCMRSPPRLRLAVTACVVPPAPRCATPSARSARQARPKPRSSPPPPPTAAPAMLIKEYRIPFPATLEEYRVGMLYMISRATEEENKRTKGKKAVEVVKRERYYDSARGIHGVYTEKVCHVHNFLPAFIKVFVPERSCVLIEKAWNGFPEHCLTVYESPFLGDSFHLSIESRYVANDNGRHENALSLPPSELSAREVVALDIASEEHLGMTADTDVRAFRSSREARPVLDGGGVWLRGGGPMMCCYRVARLDVATKGLPGGRMERWGHRHGFQFAFLRYNRQALCWMDSWLGLGIGDVDGLGGKPTGGRRAKREMAKTAIATEIAAESSAGLAFSFSDETNPFFA